MNNIIAYSLYGKDQRYVEGVIANVELAKKYYPGWTVRVYTDIDQDLDVDCEVLCKEKSVGHRGLFWRFEVLKDISIDHCIIRDLDSRLGPREASAVNEWVSSNKEFHIIRDNVQHAVPICGGMWGASSKFIKRFAPVYDEKYKHHMATLLPLQLFHIRGQYFNTDQPFLWKYVWPLIKDSHMAHIGPYDNCKITGFELPLTTDNPDKTFIGQPI